MSPRDDARYTTVKQLAWLLMLSVLALFAHTLRLQHRPSNPPAVAPQFSHPNPLFAHAHQADLSPGE